MSTWANHPRIEKIARDRLHMVTPGAQQPATAKGAR
jgi:cell division protein FtsL